MTTIIQKVKPYEDKLYQKNPNFKQKVNEQVRLNKPKKPEIPTLDEFLDWKSDIWEVQFKADDRVQYLFNNILTQDERDNFFDTIILNPYIPEVPFYNQILLLLNDGYTLYGGSRGGGKALSLDTLIPTPNGFTTMEELLVGDEVFDENGDICHVLSKSDVFFDHDCYELVFDDGNSVIADANHKWLTDDTRSRASKSRMKNRDYKNNQFSRNQDHKKLSAEVRTTEEIYNTLNKKVGNRYDTNHSIDVCKPLNLPEKELPIDPYILGLWLGDGTSSCGSFTTVDLEFLDAFKDEGYEVHERTAEYCYGIIGLEHDLRENNLLNNKHIPKEYLRASYEQRLALIQGLMDTDGNILKTHQCEFVQKNENIIDGLIELLHTFGVKVKKRITYKSHSKNAEKKPYFSIKFTTNLPVFRLKRKVERLPTKPRSTTKKRYIKECNPIDSVPCQCIIVDSPSHLFLCTENFIPTHNSSCVLMNALQYVDFPDWKAGIFRLTYKDLSVPGAIMHRAEEWLDNNQMLEKEGISPKLNRGEYTFTFPSGSKMFFGHIQHENDVNNYQGSEFHLLAFDEAVQFTENKITRLLGSNRKKFDDPLPLKVIFTGNPGGVSHQYFKEKYVNGDKVFIDSNYKDNIYLNQKEYEESTFESIKMSDPILYQQWKYGNWDAVPEGNIFKTSWFKTYDYINEKIVQRVRFWDLAATEEVDPTSSQDPDYCVGVLLLKGESGRLYLDNIVRFREDPDKTEENILQVAMLDGSEVSLRLEQEGGASAKLYLNTLQRKLQGLDFDADSPRTNKIERAKTMLSSIKFGNLKFRDNEPWTTDFLNEITSFPTKGIHDDQVDALSGAFAFMSDFSEKQTPTSIDVDDDLFVLWNEMI